MAQFVEIAALAIGLLWPIATPSARAPVVPDAAILNGPANNEELAAAYRHLQRAGCTDSECLALQDVIDAFELMGYRDTPSGNTLLDPSKFDPHQFAVKLAKLLRSHPDRWPRYCGILEKLARHYQDPSLGFQVAELSGRISSSSLDCAAAVIPAFPDTRDSRDTIEITLEECEPADHPGCAEIIRAITIRRARLHQQ